MRVAWIFFLIYLSAGSIAAQPFHTDSLGHVTDPEFRQFIKERGYRFVETFYATGSSNRIAKAQAKNNEWIHIDLNGKEYGEAEWANYILQLMQFHADEWENEWPEGFDPEAEYIAEQGREEEGPNWEKSPMKIFQSGEKYGCIINDDTLLPAIHELIVPGFNKNEWVIAVKDKGTLNVLNIKGEVLLQTAYEDIRFTANHIENPGYFVQEQGKWGFINLAGEIIVPLNYCFLDFSRKKDFLLCRESCRDHALGALNLDGRLIVPMQFDHIDRQDTNDCLFASRQNSKKWAVGAYDLNGNKLLDTIYTSISWHSPDVYLLAMDGERGNRTGLFNAKLQQITLPCEYHIEQFGWEYSVVRKTENGKNQFGLLGKHGELVLEAVYDSLVVLDEEHFVILEKDRKFGLADMEGVKSISCLYDTLFSIKSQVVPQATEHYPVGHFIFRQQGKYGLVNYLNELVIPAKYDELKASYDGLIFRTGEQTGVIDLSDKLLVAPFTGKIESIHNGIITGRNAKGHYLVMDYYGNSITYQ